MRTILVAATLMSVSGCVQQQVMPLAPNIVRIDTQAAGRLFVGSAPQATMRKAAEVTLAAGYTHFRLDQAQTSQGSQFGGVITTGRSSGSFDATATRFGNTTFVSGTSSAFGTGIATPMYRPTANIGVTVIMFHASEPGAKGAFDAAQVWSKQ